MRAFPPVLAATLALSAVAATAQTVQTQVSARQGAIEAAELVTVDAILQSIDLSTREVGLRTSQGRDLVVIAGPEVQRLADLKVGDRVEMQVYESLTLSLSKVPGAAAQGEVATEVRALPTELPGGVKTRQTTIVAQVTAVDAAASTVTLTGPKGRSITLAVDAEIVANVAVGDRVSAVYTEAVAVSVSRAAGY